MKQDYIIHYGVKGMRWGVRHDRERVGRRRKKSEKASNNKKNKGLSTGAKVAIGVGATAAALAIGYFGAKKLGLINDSTLKNSKEALSNLIKNGKKSNTKEAINRAKKLSNKKINPTGNMTNCISCSAATVLNMKGFDVQATAHEPEITLDSMVKSVFKDAKISEMRVSNKERLTNFCKKQGNGAYGIIASYYDMGFGQTAGHSYNYIVENGKVNFFDNQNDKGMWTNIMRQYDELDMFKNSFIVRLDNVEVNTDAIDNVTSRWVVKDR